MTPGGAPLWQRSAAALAAAFADGTATPVDALAAIAGRLAEMQPLLNMMAATDLDAARQAATASTARWRAGRPLGPLDGVPFTVKDNIHAAGLPTVWGSAAFRDTTPDADETSVARLRAAGAVVIGKTNVPELTMEGITDNPVFGPTRNPWNRALTPGGSSGGAVAAVAAGVGPFALGTDGGGSIRRPAAYTGLYGLKPSPGCVDRDGGLPTILLDLEVIGPVARTAQDMATVMETIAPGMVIPEAAPACRVRYVAAFGTHPVEPEVATMTERAAQTLAALGHAVETGPPPFDPDEVAALHAVVSQAGLAWLAAERGVAPARASLQGTLAEGRALGRDALFGALARLTALRRMMAAHLGPRDLILTAAAAAHPWPIGTDYPATIAGLPAGPRGHAVFTGFVNDLGLAAVALPCGLSAAGLPVGVQCVGRAGSDGLLLALARDWERAHPTEPWAGRWPDL